MSITFPFEEEKGIFGKVTRPVATIYFRPKGKIVWQPIRMLVDSSADCTLLPYHLASLLEVNLTKDCKVVDTEGVGGVSKGYFLNGKIKVKLGNFERNIPVVFLPTDKIPPLLGRSGFFETFKIIFEEFTVTFE